MSKQKSKIVSKYPAKRRTTFKKHKKHYLRVYAPYLPAVIGLIVGASLLLPAKLPSVRSVLSYKTSISSGGLLKQTNKSREAQGGKDLSMNDRLSAAAQAKAYDMAQRDYWSHNTPDGKQPWYFINQTGYKYSEASENLAYGFASDADTIIGWMNSPEHRKAMLEKDYTEVGFGIANSNNYQGQGPETIVVAMYAKPQATAFGGAGSVLAGTDSHNISKGQLITKGKLGWLNIVFGAGIGLIAMYLILKHSVKVRRKLRHGERYILKNPAFDATLISLLVLLVALSKTVGFIH